MEQANCKMQHKRGPCILKFSKPMLQMPKALFYNMSGYMMADILCLCLLLVWADAQQSTVIKTFQGDK